MCFSVCLYLLCFFSGSFSSVCHILVYLSCFILVFFFYLRHGRSRERGNANQNILYIVSIFTKREKKKVNTFNSIGGVAETEEYYLGLLASPRLQFQNTS